MRKSILLTTLALFASLFSFSQSKKFNWIAWDKVSASIKADLKKIIQSQNKTVEPVSITDPPFDNNGNAF